jgi:hypothetical protein
MKRILFILLLFVKFVIPPLSPFPREGEGWAGMKKVDIQNYS